MDDLCQQCNQELRAECPNCGRVVLIQKGALAPHDRMIVHTSHITWGTCPESRKPYAKKVC